MRVFEIGFQFNTTRKKENILKTLFGLHNPLMTLGSLEISNSWCLMSVLQVGTRDGVIELSAKYEIIQSADCLFFFLFQKEFCFNVLSAFKIIIWKAQGVPQ